MTQFVVRDSPVRMILLIALAIGFVAAAGLMVSDVGGGPSFSELLWGWLGIVFAAACALLLIRRALGAREQIIVDDLGVLCRQWSDTVIPWSAIHSVELRKMNGQQFVCLFLHDRRDYPSTRLLGRLSAANRSLGFGDISLTTTASGTRACDLFEAIRWRLPR